MLSAGTTTELAKRVPRDPHRKILFDYLDINRRNADKNENFYGLSAERLKTLVNDCDTFEWVPDSETRNILSGLEFENAFWLLQSPVIETAKNLLEFSIDDDSDAMSLTQRSASSNDRLAGSESDSIAQDTEASSNDRRAGSESDSIAQDTEVDGHVPRTSVMERDSTIRPSSLMSLSAHLTLSDLEEYIVSSTEAAITDSSLSIASSQHFAEAVFMHLAEKLMGSVNS